MVIHRGCDLAPERRISPGPRWSPGGRRSDIVVEINETGLTDVMTALPSNQRSLAVITIITFTRTLQSVDATVRI